MKDKVKLVDNKDTTQFHIDPIKCYGCGEQFEVTVRDNPYDDKKKYYAICFGNIYGLDVFEKILKQFNPLMRTAWEIPSDKLPEDIRRQFHRERNE